MLRKGEIGLFAKIPRLTHVRIAGLNVEPEPMNEDLVVFDDFQEFIELLLDRFARFAAGLGAGA